MKHFSDIIYDFGPIIFTTVLVVAVCFIQYTHNKHRQEVFATCLSNGGTPESCAMVAGLVK